MAKQNSVRQLIEEFLEEPRNAVARLAALHKKIDSSIEKLTVEPSEKPAFTSITVDKKKCRQIADELHQTSLALEVLKNPKPELQAVVGRLLEAMTTLEGAFRDKSTDTPNILSSVLLASLRSIQENSESLSMLLPGTQTREEPKDDLRVFERVEIELTRILDDDERWIRFSSQSQRKQALGLRCSRPTLKKVLESENIAKLLASRKRRR